MGKQVEKRNNRTGELVAYDAMVNNDGKVREVVQVNDSFSNPWARLGVGQENLLEKTEYPLTRLTMNYNLMNSLFRDNWIVQNIVSMVPEDMCKNWFKIKSDIEPKLIDRFNKVMRVTKLKRKVIEGLKWGRLYGGAIGLILIDGQQDRLSTPLELEDIGLDSFRGLYIVDRWSGVYPDIEIISDMNDPELGNPKYYNIKSYDGTVVNKVHHSRIVKFTGRELPFVERLAEEYWGTSEIESVYKEVVKRDNVSENIANLTFRANLSIYEMENLEQLFAVSGTEAQKRFWNLIQAQTMLESNLGVKMVNKGDNFRRDTYNFAGLSEVYESIMMDVAGSTHIPVTKLFGRSPAGMNATGESDSENYFNYLEQQRDTQLTPAIDKLLPIIAVSTFGKIPEDLDYVYEDIRTVSDEQKVSIAEKKANIIFSAYQSNAISQKGAMKELASLSDKYDIFNSIDEDVIDKAEDKFVNDFSQMQDPMGGLSLGSMEGLGDGQEMQESTFGNTENENMNEHMSSTRENKENTKERKEDISKEEVKDGEEEDLVDKIRNATRLVRSLTPNTVIEIPKKEVYIDPDIIGPKKTKYENIAGGELQVQKQEQVEKTKGVYYMGEENKESQVVTAINGAIKVIKTDDSGKSLVEVINKNGKAQRIWKKLK